MDFWNDKDMLDFARVATEGAYGKYRNCKKLIDKLKYFRPLFCRKIPNNGEFGRT